MKLGMYLKESWYNLRKDRVYSAVYIIGTGFSLALVMAYLTVQSMHFDNSYPEVNRDRMLVIPTFMESQKGSQGGSNAMVSQVFVDRFIRNEPVEGLETLTTVAFRDAVVANDLQCGLGRGYGVLEGLRLRLSLRACPLGDELQSGCSRGGHLRVTGQDPVRQGGYSGGEALHRR